MRQSAEKVNQIIKYVISFLVRGDETLISQIFYGSGDTERSSAKIIIIASGHLGGELVLPDMGEVRFYYFGGKLYIETDIVYNTFFFMSCAEELLSGSRDRHGRFVSAYSILNQGERLRRAIIDEYSYFLLSNLGKSIPSPKFGHVYLTHDVDYIAYYRNIYGALRGIIKGESKNVFRSLSNIEFDPAFTFSWLVTQDKKIKDGMAIYFIKDTLGKGFDYPQYDLDGKDYCYLFSLLKEAGAYLGWHSSYYSVRNTKYEIEEIRERGVDYHWHRSHFLQIDIERLEQLDAVGVSDDFSVGFADRAGFRCQTTRSFLWINPKTYAISGVTIHPLMLMDVSLSASHYMDLGFEEAFTYARELVETVRKYNGDLCLLWHNTSLEAKSYHKRLYSAILSLL